MITAAVVTAGAGIYTSAQASKAAGKASSRVEGLEYPDYYEDEYYNKSQEKLSGLGETILEGDVPDFFSDIGQANSESFQKYLNMSNADIQENVLETAAATGRTGGAVQSVSAEAVGKNTTALGYQDYLDSKEGKQWLMAMGVDITSGVRSAGTQREQGVNEFNVGEANYDFDVAGYLDQSDAAIGAAQGKADAELYGGILKAGTGALKGYASGGWMGALQGLGGIA